MSNSATQRRQKAAASAAKALAARKSRRGEAHGPWTKAAAAALLRRRDAHRDLLRHAVHGLRENPQAASRDLRSTEARLGWISRGLPEGCEACDGGDALWEWLSELSPAERVAAGAVRDPKAVYLRLLVASDKIQKECNAKSALSDTEMREQCTAKQLLVFIRHDDAQSDDWLGPVYPGGADPRFAAADVLHSLESLPELAFAFQPLPWASMVPDVSELERGRQELLAFTHDSALDWDQNDLLLAYLQVCDIDMVPAILLPQLADVDNLATVRDVLRGASSLCTGMALDTKETVAGDPFRKQVTVRREQAVLSPGAVIAIRVVGALWRSFQAWRESARSAAVPTPVAEAVGGAGHACTATLETNFDDRKHSLIVPDSISEPLRGDGAAASRWLKMSAAERTAWLEETAATLGHSGAILPVVVSTAIRVFEGRLPRISAEAGGRVAGAARLLAWSSLQSYALPATKLLRAAFVRLLERVQREAAFALAESEAKALEMEAKALEAKASGNGGASKRRGSNGGMANGTGAAAGKKGKSRRRARKARAGAATGGDVATQSQAEKLAADAAEAEAEAKAEAAAAALRARALREEATDAATAACMLLVESVFTSVERAARRAAVRAQKRQRRAEKFYAWMHDTVVVGDVLDAVMSQFGGRAEDVWQASMALVADESVPHELALCEEERGNAAGMIVAAVAAYGSTHDRHGSDAAAELVVAAGAPPWSLSESKDLAPAACRLAVALVQCEGHPDNMVRRPSSDRSWAERLYGVTPFGPPDALSRVFSDSAAAVSRLGAIVGECTLARSRAVLAHRHVDMVALCEGAGGLGGGELAAAFVCAVLRRAHATLRGVTVFPSTSPWLRGCLRAAQSVASVSGGAGGADGAAVPGSAGDVQSVAASLGINADALDPIDATSSDALSKRGTEWEFCGGVFNVPSIPRGDDDAGASKSGTQQLGLATSERTRIEASSSQDDAAGSVSEVDAPEPSESGGSDEERGSAVSSATPTAQAAPASPVAPPPCSCSALHSLALHQDVVDMAIALAQMSSGQREQQVKAVEAVERVCRSLWPSARVEVYGSLATGLSVPSSDVDLVVCDVHEYYAALLSGIKPKGKLNCIAKLADALGREGWVRSVNAIEGAATPVVKILTEGGGQSAAGLKIDVTFDAPYHRGLATAALVRRLLGDFPALTPLTLVLKQLLLQKGLNDAFVGGLSSYGLLLAVTASLQRDGGTDLSALPRQVGAGIGVMEPMSRATQAAAAAAASSSAAAARASRGASVPNLGPKVVERLASFSSVPRAPGSLPLPPPTAGPRGLGDALLSFLEFVGGKLDPATTGLTVRHGRVELPRAFTADSLFVGDPLVLEDPLDPRNNVGRTCFGISQVQEAFRSAAKAVRARQALPHPRCLAHGGTPRFLSNGALDVSLGGAESLLGHAFGAQHHSSVVMYLMSLWRPGDDAGALRARTASGGAGGTRTALAVTGAATARPGLVAHGAMAPPSHAAVAPPPPPAAMLQPPASVPGVAPSGLVGPVHAVGLGRATPIEMWAGDALALLRGLGGGASRVGRCAECSAPPGTRHAPGCRIDVLIRAFPAAAPR